MLEIVKMVILGNIFGYYLWVFVGILVGWYWWYKQIKKDEKLGVPKGNFCWPLVGETLDFIACGCSSRPVSFMDKRKSLHGKVFKTHILGTPVIVSTDPEVNKVVLHNSGNIFIPNYPKTVKELLGEFSILQMNGALHKRMHGLIGGFLKSPQFKDRITPVIENAVKLSLASWQNDHNNIVCVQDETKKITFEVLVRVLTSICPGEELDFLRREYAEFIRGMICLPIKLPGFRLYKSLQAKEKMLNMIKKIMEERKAAMRSSDKEEENSQPTDAVDLLLREAIIESNEKQSPSLDSISSNIIEMMIPGEDSVPITMTLAVKFLSDSPVALTRLAEENMELKRRKADRGDAYSWTDYMSLQFTQHVINETLRMANIINAVWRKALKDVEIKGHLIPKGWCVLASLTSVHMDEEIYENPYQFDPWRWQKAEGVTNNNCFTPFGGGQRLCPGLELSKLEIAIFLHHLVTTYRWAAEKDEIVYFPTVKTRRKMPIMVSTIRS